MDDFRELELERLSLEDLDCIRDTILAELDRRAEVVHASSTATASCNPSRAENNQSSSQHPTPTTPTTTNLSQDDSAALRSQLQFMQKRIDNLERENLELSMSKAPLEACIRQKEDMLRKERERAANYINEALEEHNSRWNRDDEIKSLRIEILSLESEVFGYQLEIETLERKYDELEKDYQACRTGKSAGDDVEEDDPSLEDGDPEVINLVSPVKRQKDNKNWEEVDGDVCISESLGMEDAVARRVKEAEANGDVIQCDN